MDDRELYQHLIEIKEKLNEIESEIIQQSEQEAKTRKREIRIQPKEERE